jgi:hypothetical protein
MEPERIGAEEVMKRQRNGEHVVLLDARSNDAWRKADTQITGSKRVPPDRVDQHLKEIPRDALIVPYCT